MLMVNNSQVMVTKSKIRAMHTKQMVCYSMLPVYKSKQKSPNRVSDWGFQYQLVSCLFLHRFGNSLNNFFYCFSYHFTSSVRYSFGRNRCFSHRAVISSFNLNSHFNRWLIQ